METYSTDFFLRGISPIVFKVFFGSSGGLDRGDVRRGAG